MFADQDHQPQGKHSQVPMRAYYAYLINKRVGIENTIIKVGRLDYIRPNQGDLISGVYKGIHKAILRDVKVMLLVAQVI